VISCVLLHTHIYLNFSIGAGQFICYAQNFDVFFQTNAMYKNCNDNISLVSEILACVQTVNGSKSIYQLIVCKHQNIQKIRFKTTGDL
jgi:hypothetical protein